MGDAETIVVYFSSVSSNAELKKHQRRIEDVLDAKKIQYEKVDISADEEMRAKMRELCGDPKALPPRICKGEVYLGDYEAFDNAVESEDLCGFLKMS